jgi:hypothetical protein
MSLKRFARSTQISFPWQFLLLIVLELVRSEIGLASIGNNKISVSELDVNFVGE